jgi:hypothetical protein
LENGDEVTYRLVQSVPGKGRIYLKKHMTSGKTEGNGSKWEREA